jgi:hypothetical protein
MGGQPVTAKRLIGFDIPGLQRYVFAPVRPVDVTGGSRLLERFADRAVQLAAEVGADPIYCGGGNGLFLGPATTNGAPLEARWGRELERLTAGAVELVAAGVPLEGSLVEARDHLKGALEDQRAARLLDRPSKEFLPDQTWPDKLCQGCGMEPGTIQDSVGGTPEMIGPQCKARRDEGRRAGAVALPDLFVRSHPTAEAARDEGDPDRPPPGAVLGALYFDADGLGRELAGLQTPEELRQASSDVRGLVDKAVATARAEAERMGRRVLDPVVGGDDVLLFLDAQLLPSVLEVLIDRLADSEGSLRFRFSGAVVLADPYAPLRHVFAVARASLKAAKLLAHRTSEPHLAIRSMLAARLHPGTLHLFGGPIPCRFVVAGSETPSRLRSLTDAIAQIADRAQRAGLASDLLGSQSEEERRLAVEYRLAQRGDRALRAALSEAERWSRELPGRSLSEVLLGGLAMAELWEGTGG